MFQQCLFHREARWNAAKFWVTGLGLWAGTCGMGANLFAQQPANLPNSEYSEIVDSIVENEIQQSGFFQDAQNPLPATNYSASTGAAGSGNYTYNTTCPTGECWQGEFCSIQDVFNRPCGGNWLTDNGLAMGGSIVNSMTFNTDAPKDKFNGPVTWMDRSNEWQLNQAWLYLEKPLDADAEYDIGGRVDVMYGSNFRFMTSTGLEDNLNGSHSFYGVAIPQAYITSKYKNVTLKSGHWFSPVGYFGVDMTGNFFNTLPYTYQYGEPFTHSGTLAQVQVNDTLNVGAGFIRGWDNFDTTNPNVGGIATVSKTFDNGGSLAFVGMISQEQNQALVFRGRYLQTLVYTKNVTDKITSVTQSDFGYQNDAIAVSGKDARWYGINQYFIYKKNECLSYGVNFEWFRDEEGYRVGGFLPNTFAVPGSQVRGLATNRYGYAGNFFQVTMGPKWNPTKNVMIRPNLRFDWFDGGIQKDVNPGLLKPFSDGTKNAQTIFSTDFVLFF